jgi:hypothetical protein
MLLALAQAVQLPECGEVTPPPFEHEPPALACAYHRCPELPTELTARFAIDASGQAIDIVVEGEPALHRSVVRALQGWRWAPTDACQGASWTFKMEWQDGERR